MAKMICKSMYTWFLVTLTCQYIHRGGPGLERVPWEAGLGEPCCSTKQLWGIPLAAWPGFAAQGSLLQALYAISP